MVWMQTDWTEVRAGSLQGKVSGGGWTLNVLLPCCVPGEFLTGSIVSSFDVLLL